MRSRPDLRRSLELGARVAAIALLAWMIVRSVAPRDTGTVEERTDSGALPAALASWTLAPEPTAVQVTLATAPGARDREWLRALAHAGVRVAWAADSLPAIALEVVSRSDPAGGVRAFVAAPPGSHAELSDAIGRLDSFTVAPGVNALGISIAAGALDLAVRGQHARASARDSVLPRQIVVLGEAGWEGKFAIAALEERGWRVSSRLRVAPGVFVTQGTPRALDTAQTGAVVVLDSSAAPFAGAVAAFERDGGGVVLAGDAARIGALRALAPGRVGARVAAATITFASKDPRRALGFFPIIALAPDALPLESRDGHVAAAARRVGAGRVLQLGYDESWRWRLAGAGDAPAAHREFWSAIVSSVAYRATTATVPPSGDGAPLASLYAALGNPAPARAAASIAAGGLPWWSLAAFALLLVCEWGSRRARGAR